MKNRNTIQSPGLPKKKFGSKIFLRKIRKRVKNNVSKPKKI